MKVNSDINSLFCIRHIYEIPQEGIIPQFSKLTTKALTNGNNQPSLLSKCY